MMQHNEICEVDSLRKFGLNTECQAKCEIYFQILEEKPSSLPWLENQRLNNQMESKKKDGPFKDAPAAVWKAYVSGKRSNMKTHTQILWQVCTSAENSYRSHSSSLKFYIFSSIWWCNNNKQSTQTILL